MSIMEIPDELYETIFHMEVARQINKGLDLKAAREMANQIMGHCFMSRSAQIQCDTQKDYDDMRQGDWTR